MARHVSWNGVFPAVTTQFREDFSLDVEATQRVIEGLLRDGVSGLIVCGTVGENCSLSRAEKVAVMTAAVGDKTSKSIWSQTHFGSRMLAPTLSQKALMPMASVSREVMT